MLFIRTNVAALASVAGLAMAGNAHAQSVDYGALEELFNEPVTTSATGAPQRSTEAPVNMTIITQEEIRRSGAIDIGGVLESLAHVDALRNFRTQTDISVRGYNMGISPRLLVLVNGRQVYLDHYGMTNWDSIPVQLSEIRQIEVVSGPNTALFGFNAVAGVVNILTYDTVRDDVDTASVRIGDPEYKGGSLVTSFKPTEQMGVRLSLGGVDQDLFSDEESVAASLGGIDPETRTASVNLGYDFTPTLRGDVEATWSSNERLERFGGSPYLGFYETNSIKASLSASTSLGMVTAQAYSNTLDLSIDLGGIGMVMDNNITVGSLSLVAKPAPAHTVRVAGELRHNTLEQASSSGEISYNVASLSGMWTWQATSALAVTSALRFDSLELERNGASPAGFPWANSVYDQDFAEISYNIGAVYKVTDMDSLRLSVSRGVGSPSLLDYGFQLPLSPPAPGMSLFYVGDPTVDPAIVLNAELGWDHSIPAIDGLFRASIYWQTNEDLRLLGVTTTISPPATLLNRAANIGDSDLFGLDLGIEGQSGPLSWFANYSWRSIEDELTTSPAAIQVAFEQTSPEQVATGGVTYTAGKWEVGGDVRYTGETSQYGLGSAPFALSPVDAYLQANAHVAWLPSDDVRIEVSARDFIEDEQETIGASPVERAVFVTLTKSW